MRRYTLALWLLAALFCLRVLGQLLVAVFGISFLPPMAAWYSGLLRYRVLLPIQLLIVALQIKIGVDFWKAIGFFVVPRPWMGRIVCWFSAIYFASMLLRYISTRTLLIPVIFHWILAAYLFVLGFFHIRGGAGPIDEPLGTG